MSRHCERPGCSKVGEIVYEVDLRRLVVTIDFPDLNDASPVNLLCRRHADSLTVPKGWTIINNREEVQRLFSAPATQEVLKNDSRKVVRRQKVSDFNEDEKDPAVISNLFDLVIDDNYKDKQPSCSVFKSFLTRVDKETYKVSVCENKMILHSEESNTMVALNLAITE